MGLTPNSLMGPAFDSEVGARLGRKGGCGPGGEVHLSSSSTGNWPGIVEMNHWPQWFPLLPPWSHPLFIAAIPGLRLLCGQAGIIPALSGFYP